MEIGTKTKTRISKISMMHYFKLVFRSILLLMATIAYITGRINSDDRLQNYIGRYPIVMLIIWFVFVTEMIFRLFPSGFESMGCQKQFKCNYRPTEKAVHAVKKAKGAFITALVWVLLNSAIGSLYFMKIIDRGILLLISLAYSVCDMICILFFCPFQTWIMKNKCCGSCRIYNWDYIMMFTPLVFMNTLYAWSLIAPAIILLLQWEILYYRYPERFAEETNASLACINCQEKLCQHKKQLQRFLRKQSYIQAQIESGLKSLKSSETHGVLNRISQNRK